MRDIIGAELYSLLKELEKLKKEFESIIDGSEVHTSFILENRVIEKFPRSGPVLREYIETHIDYLERVSGREDLEHDTYYHAGQRLLAHLNQAKLTDFWRRND